MRFGRVLGTALECGHVLDMALECGRVLGTALECGRVLGTALRRFAGMGACWARRVVCVEVRACAGYGIGVVCGCGRVPGTAGGGWFAGRKDALRVRAQNRSVIRRFASLAAAGRGE